MTVSSTNRKAGPYYGNGVTAAFPFSFKVFAASDLLVVKTNLTTGIDTVLAATDYSVSLTADTTGGYSSGTVTLTAGALASGYTLTISSSILYTQNTDLTNNGGFYPKVINSALDRLTILCQQLLEQVSRSLKLSISTPANVKPTLPAPVKNNMIAWNENADGLQNLDPQALATIVAFGTANSDKFSGDGTTTQFALSNNPGALNNLDVSIGGVTQRPGIDYTWSAGTVITFTTAPAAGTNNILVRYMQGLPQGYTTSDLVQHGSSNVKDALDAINLTDYAALRTYTGQSKRVFITGYFVTSAPSGIAGDFVRDDSDTTSADNGGTIIVSTNGKRWKRQHSYFVSVKWFGAVGDRIADDTQPISNAIATGKSVFFPKGNYLSGLQELPNQGQCLFGEGASSILTPISKGIHLLFPKATYVTISDMRLNGIETDATNSVFAIHTSSATPATYLTVRNVLFSGFDTTLGFSNAIKFDDNCSYGLVENCTIERLWGNTSGHGYGVLAGNVTGCKVLSNNFIASSGRGRHGIYFSAGCSNSVADDNLISGFDYEGISQYSAGAQPTCARNVYNNNVLLGCAASTNPFSGSIGIYQHSYGCVISNNVITGSGKKSIAVDAGGVTDCLNTVITGNTISYSGSTGIDLTGTKNTVISSNTIQDSSTSSAGSFANIMLRASGGYNCDNTLIEGNIVPASSTARSALSLDPGSGGPTSLKLSDNSFGAGVSYTLELNSVTGIEIDGRLQFRFDSVGYGPIANGASFTGPLVLAGAKQGDICTVSHTSNHDGCVMYAYCNSDGTGVLTIANLSGASKTIPTGTLRVDVWKRNSPL